MNADFFTSSDGIVWTAEQLSAAMRLAAQRRSRSFGAMDLSARLTVTLPQLAAVAALSKEAAQ